MPQIQQALPENPQATPAKEARELTAIFTSPSIPQSPVSQSHPQLLSKHLLWPLLTLPPYPEDWLSRSGCNPYFPPPPHPKPQLLIARHVSLEPTGATLLKNFLPGNTWPPQRGNRNQETKHLANKDKISAPRIYSLPNTWCLDASVKNTGMPRTLSLQSPATPPQQALNIPTWLTCARRCENRIVRHIHFAYTRKENLNF
jgi:hypothetical protein